MPDHIFLTIAKEYGVAPHTIEDWPECYLNRAILKLQAENINAAKRQRESERRRK